MPHYYFVARKIVQWKFLTTATQQDVPMAHVILKEAVKDGKSAAIESLATSK